MSGVTTILYERCPDCDTAFRWNYKTQVCDACGRGKPEPTAAAMTNGALDVLRERDRQMSAEGWSAKHDDRHARGELAHAAACYIIGPPRVLAEGGETTTPPRFRDAWVGWLRWPWEGSWWKPRTIRQNLVRGAALALAEIDRLDRQEARREAEMRGDG
jgi:hypothetical protein